jgi:hypothetical protein
MQTPHTGIRDVNQRRNYPFGSPFSLTRTITTQHAQFLVGLKEIVRIAPVERLVTVAVWVSFLGKDFFFTDA